MVASTYLRDKLRGFADPDYSGFTGFPPSKDAARQAWADAFSDYFDQVTEDETGIAPHHPTLVMTNVNSSFFGDLGLDPTTSATAAAADFAGAWKTAVQAVTFLPAPVGANTLTPLSFTNVPGQHGTLQSTLAALFADVLGTPTATAVARLGDIAAAFHAATVGLVASATRVNTSSGATVAPPTMTLH